MKKFVKDYYSELGSLFSAVSASGPDGGKLDFGGGVALAADLMRAACGAGRKIMFVGNGASAAISSHLAADYLKNGGMRALAFNDAALLTCVSNDISYSKVFEVPLKAMADAGDLLVAISSSGRSPNVIAAAKAASAAGCTVITLTGFSASNPLRRLGAVNFHAPSSLYGHVEIVHHSICHCILEHIIEGAKKR
ncbi:MAG TPA: SIS domain-containing protein [Elusimicrobiales bacterium]|nr:SIS domain-containing protein [Elusimicrobiales bacterium]